MKNANLGKFSEESFLLFSELYEQRLEEQGVFEEGTDNFNFTRCERPDGSVYGTGGQCRKGKETNKRPTDSEREAAIMGSGGHAPVLRPPLTEEQKDSAIKRGEKGAKERAERQKSAEVLKNNAEKISSAIGGHPSDLIDLGKSSNTEIKQAIMDGDSKKVEQIIRNRGELKDYVNRAASEAREAQKANLKELLSNAPKERHSKIISDQKYYASEEVKKAKGLAKRDWETMESIEIKMNQKARGS